MVCTVHDHGLMISSKLYMPCQCYWPKIVRTSVVFSVYTTAQSKSRLMLAGRDFLGTGTTVDVFHKVGSVCKLREA